MKFPIVEAKSPSCGFCDKQLSCWFSVNKQTSSQLSSQVAFHISRSLPCVPVPESPFWDGSTGWASGQLDCHDFPFKWSFPNGHNLWFATNHGNLHDWTNSHLYGNHPGKWPYIFGSLIDHSFYLDAMECPIRCLYQLRNCLYFERLEADHIQCPGTCRRLASLLQHGFFHVQRISLGKALWPNQVPDYFDNFCGVHECFLPWPQLLLIPSIIWQILSPNLCRWILWCHFRSQSPLHPLLWGCRREHYGDPCSTSLYILGWTVLHLVDFTKRILRRPLGWNPRWISIYSWTT